MVSIQPYMIPKIRNLVSQHSAMCHQRSATCYRLLPLVTFLPPLVTEGFPIPELAALSRTWARRPCHYVLIWTCRPYRYLLTWTCRSRRYVLTWACRLLHYVMNLSLPASPLCRELGFASLAANSASLFLCRFSLSLHLRPSLVALSWTRPRHLGARLTSSLYRGLGLVTLLQV
ncbi:unnamed protein product [Arabis nemorensis]|uniref:Uncharacterized protein n=1 Tax=Arabis nemorensis TaxID=586526 RepID=A0A565BT29_9BRAS|nr:unnamed protein product [Arabis nemorensis]